MSTMKKTKAGRLDVYKMLLSQVDSTEDYDCNPLTFLEKLSNYSFELIRNRGNNWYGYNNSIPRIVMDNGFLCNNENWVNHTQAGLSVPLNPLLSGSIIPKWGVCDIVRVLLHKTAAQP
jgi:hypothetical protein